jgi:hypothetical protein
MRYKVYLAKLKRLNGNPRTVYKIGITSSSDAMDRINYRGDDEPYPITNYFNDNKIMKAVWKESKEEAEALEILIMNTIKGNEKYFHNWYEPDQISGITEMRKWNYEEVQKVFELLN